MWNNSSLPPVTCVKSCEFPLNEKFPQKGKCWQMHLFLASWTCPSSDVGMWSGSEWMYVRAGCVMHQVYRSWIVAAGVLWAKFPRWGYEYEWVSPLMPWKMLKVPLQAGRTKCTDCHSGVCCFGTASLVWSTDCQKAGKSFSHSTSQSQF